MEKKGSWEIKICGVEVKVKVEVEVDVRQMKM